MPSGNKQYNQEFLKEILGKSPDTRFVFFRRYGGSFKGDFVDIPIEQAVFTINQFPGWELITKEGKITKKKITQLKEENCFKVPSKPARISDKEFDKIMNRKKPKKFVYIKNQFGKIVDIPLKDLERTLKQPGMVLVSEEISNKQIEAPIIDKNPLECPICGFRAKSKSGLMLHNKKHK